MADIFTFRQKPIAAFLAALGCPTTSEPLAAVSALATPLLTDWLAFLRGEAPNPVPGREGQAAVQIATACLRSAATACWQPVQP